MCVSVILQILRQYTWDNMQNKSKYCVVGHITIRPTGGVFFFGVRIWLVMTFNYPVLRIRVKGQVLGSVNSNHNHNPKHIYNPNLTLILTLTLNLPWPYHHTNRNP